LKVNAPLMVLTSALTVLIAGCSNTLGSPSTLTTERDAPLQCASEFPWIEDAIATALASARNLLARELADYPSARFQSVFAIGSVHGDVITFCGRMVDGSATVGTNDWTTFMIYTSPRRDSFMTMADENPGDQMLDMICGRELEVHEFALPVTCDLAERFAYR
jgi:hypothetical protein|tara:strand:+ start:74816 stop:75304 length:489 start_codon:yes stop_codon:yes gene_type:complete